MRTTKDEQALLTEALEIANGGDVSAIIGKRFAVPRAFSSGRWWLNVLEVDTRASIPYVKVGDSEHERSGPPYWKRMADLEVKYSC